MLQDYGAKKNLVPGHIVKYLGDAVTRCAHGYTVLNPLAKIDMVVDRMPIQVEAAVSKTLPVPILLGINVNELIQLLGGADPEVGKSEDVMVVVTSAQGRKLLEEELLRREKEVC